ncbi:MAG TPA: beta-galactosidase [Phycisphaerae bacterium]|nr:beta-galactosidase [Phycisphaerae bacterium]
MTRAKEGGVSVLRIKTGHSQQDWAGIELPAAGGKWDLPQYRWVAAEVRNLGTRPVNVCARMENPVVNGSTLDSVSATLPVYPRRGWQLTLVDLRRKPESTSVKLFGMAEYPWCGWAGPRERGVDPSNLVKLVIYVPKPQEDHEFEIRNIRALGRGVPVELLADPARFFPFIDEFGQYRHEDWPGKTHSVADLQKQRDAEAKDLADHPGPRDLDRYGGWKNGPTLKPTGSFRTEKYKGKWWLVDPEGKLFFSIGFCCVNSNASTFTEDRETWFKDLPALESQFKDCVGNGRAASGHYKGRRARTFDFGQANVMRKYGENWPADFSATTHARLRSWGMNTIANWSQSDICLQRKTPYAVAVWLWHMIPIKGGFYDVFHPSFGAVAEQVAQLTKPFADDPWCIGYFVDNELEWGTDDISLALASLASPPDQPAKGVFLEDLKARYDTVDKLNAAWGTSHASWDALRSSTAPPDARRARDDLAAFQTRICETYFKAVREAVRKAAPNHLYLGCRFKPQGQNAAALAAAAKYCDVVSLNLYGAWPADMKLPIEADVPLIIGEFSFAALDRGMLAGHLLDQATRAASYKQYVLGALRHPRLVGCHWFTYRDEPMTARSYDEENYQFGFIDIADTPYAEMVQAAREIGKTRYKTRAEAK